MVRAIGEEFARLNERKLKRNLLQLKLNWKQEFRLEIVTQTLMLIYMMQTANK